MASEGEKSCEGVEHRRASTADGSDGSQCYSDAEERSWHSPYSPNSAGSPYDAHRLSAASGHGIDLESGVLEPGRRSSLSCSSTEIDVETEVSEIKVNVDKVEKDCRICHLSLDSAVSESGIAIELGCSCKDDLAAAHKQCADTWFKIKGNKTCEICGSTARNVVAAGDAEVVEQFNETGSSAAPNAPTETRSFWQGHRLLNFLLACMVFAFVISWLFHFNVPS